MLQVLAKEMILVCLRRLGAHFGLFKGRGAARRVGEPQVPRCWVGIALKILKVKKRARALRFLNAAPLHALRLVTVGNITIIRWVI